MEKHVDFAHLLRWPFLLGWLIVLVVWCGVLFVPLHYASGWESYSLKLWFPQTPGLLWQTWFGYTILLLCAPFATLSPHRYWYRDLALRRHLPHRMLVASAIAAGVLNLSLLEVGLIYRDILRFGIDIKPEMLLPMDPMQRLAGILLLSFIWGHLIETLHSRPNKVLYLDYRVLISIMSAGLLIGPVGTNFIDFYTQHITSQQVWAVPGYTAAQMMQFTVLLWAMGTSAILLFGIRPFFRFANARCMHCGYDLQGSMNQVDGTCPECGHTIEQQED